MHSQIYFKIMQEDYCYFQYSNTNMHLKKDEWCEDRGLNWLMQCMCAENTSVLFVKQNALAAFTFKMAFNLLSLVQSIKLKVLKSVSMFQYKSNLLKLFQVHLNWGNIKLNFCVCRSTCLPQVEHNNWKMCHMLRPFRKWGNIYNLLLPVKQRYFSYNLPTDKLQGHKIATKFLSGVNTLLTS